MQIFCVCWASGDRDNNEKVCALCFYQSDDYMSVYRADGDNDGVMVGSTATYELLYKLPPQTSTDLTLTVDVPTSSLLSVCHVYYKEAGYDLACVDSTLNTTTVRVHIVSL